MFDKWEETLFHLDSWQVDPLRTIYKLSHLQKVDWNWGTPMITKHDEAPGINL